MPRSLMLLAIIAAFVALGLTAYLGDAVVTSPADLGTPRYLRVNPKTKIGDVLISPAFNCADIVTPDPHNWIRLNCARWAHTLVPGDPMVFVFHDKRIATP